MIFSALGIAFCTSCHMLSPEQMPRDTAGAVTWHRRISADTAFRSGPRDQPKYFRVPMVLRCRAEEVAQRVWGDDRDRRAARARARAKKKRRRRQRDAAARRKAHTKVRGSGSLSGGIPQFGDTVAVWSFGSRLERRVEGAGASMLPSESGPCVAVPIRIAGLEPLRQSEAPSHRRCLDTPRTA